LAGMCESWQRVAWRACSARLAARQIPAWQQAEAGCARVLPGQPRRPPPRLPGGASERPAARVLPRSSVPPFARFSGPGEGGHHHAPHPSRAVLASWAIAGTAPTRLGVGIPTGMAGASSGFNSAAGIAGGRNQGGAKSGAWAARVQAMAGGSPSHRRRRLGLCRAPRPAIHKSGARDGATNRSAAHHNASPKRRPWDAPAGR